MSSTVFISHSSDDRNVAEEVCAVLEEALAGLGVKCWVSWRDIPPGADWESSLLKAVTGSHVLVVIWTANANESDDVALELKHAFRKRVTVIPFRLEAVVPNEALQYRMEYVQWLDATTPPVERHLPRLVESVRGEIARRVEAEEGRARAEQEARVRAEREELERAEREVLARAKAEAAARAGEEARQHARSEAWYRTVKKAEKSARRRRRSPDKLLDVPAYMTEAIVLDASPFVGRTLAAARLSEVLNLTVVGISRGYQRLAPAADEVLRANDVLVLQARVEDILDIIPEAGIQLAPAAAYLDFESGGSGLEFFEAMVPRGSSMNGRTIRSLDFNARYGLTVLAVSRRGASLLGRLNTTTLRFGDLLLVAGRRELFERVVIDGQLSVIAEVAGGRVGGGPRRDSLIGSLLTYASNLLKPR